MEILYWDGKENLREKKGNNKDPVEAREKKSQNVRARWKCVPFVIKGDFKDGSLFKTEKCDDCKKFNVCKNNTVKFSDVFWSD